MTVFTVRGPSTWAGSGLVKSVRALGARMRPAAVIGLAVALSVLLLVAAYDLSLARLQSDRIEADRRLLDVYSAGIVGTLDRYPRSVVLLSRDPRLTGAFSGAPDAVERATAILNAYTAMSGAAMAFLLDRNGNVVAGAGDDPAVGIVAAWFRKHPAFHAALTGRLGRAFDRPAGSGPQYFYARRVRAAGETLGVLVVDVAIDELELLWRIAQRDVLVLDPDGVVVLASEPDWRLQAARDPIAGRGALPLVLPAVQDCRAGIEIDGRLCQTGLIRHLDWEVYLLSDTAPLVRQAALVTVGVALLLISLGLGAGFARQRLTLKERTNRELQSRVRVRTAELQAANTRLRNEVKSRIAKEGELREMQDELVQSEKMAALGQMSAGLVHELNQPLAALRTYNDNTEAFLERQQQGTAIKNVHLMRQLIGQMVQITKQLKSFARRTPLRLEQVDLGPVIRDAMRLVDDTAQASQIKIIDDELPDASVVLAEPVRLQQLLLNLIRNAVDAIGHQAGEVRVSVSAAAGGGYAVQVADTGPGIDAEDIDRVFEPFFTTKVTGAGLGLGLSVSKRIAREFGGDLTAANRPGGGSCFTLTLPQRANNAG